MLFSSAPPGSLIFLWIALFASYAAQTLGATLLDPALSGLRRRPGDRAADPRCWPGSGRARRPRSCCCPAFWLLLPGALGFRGVSSLATGAAGGAADLVVTGISIFAVALGRAGRHVGDQGRQAVQPDLADQVPAPAVTTPATCRACGNNNLVATVGPRAYAGPAGR